MQTAGRTSVHVALAALLATAAAVMATAVVDVPFFTKGEPREALVVQQMAATGDLILPLLDRGEIQSKPPLFHWLGLISSAAAGGVSETSVRVPSIAASLLVIGLTAATALRTSGAGAALISALVLATSFLWLQASTIARVDMTLAAAVTVSLMSFERAWAYGQRRLPTLFWLAVAAGVLAKGPVGLVLPLGVVCAYLAALGKLRSLAGARALNMPAIAVAILIALAWYLPATLEGGAAFLEKHVLRENLLRVFDAKHAGAGHVKPFWFYGPALVVGFAPWSPLLFPTLFDAWRRRGRLASDGTLFTLVWVATTVVFYSLAGSKRAIYLLSCYPALALLVGRWFAARFVDTVPVTPRPSLPALATALPAAGVVLAASTVLLEACSVPAFEALAPMLSANDAANLFAVSASITSHSGLCTAWALAAIALAGALVAAGRAGRPVVAFSLVAALVASTAATTGATVLPGLAARLSLRALLEPARSRIRPDEPLSFYDGFEYLEYVRPAAAYYAGRAVPVVDTIDAVGAGRDVGRLWFLVAESRLDALQDDAASGTRSDGREKIYDIRVLARHTYGNSPRREPLFLVEAVPVTDSQ